MMFMACSLRTFEDISVMPGAVPGTHAFSSAAKKDADGGDKPGHDAANLLDSRHIELRLLAGAVAPQRAVFADCIGALKDPVLPRCQAREDFRFHGLGPDEAQIGFHAGEAVEREAGALLEEHPDLVTPVDIVECEGDEAELLGLLGIDRLADLCLGALQIGWIGLKARLQPR